MIISHAPSASSGVTTLMSVGDDLLPSVPSLPAIPTDNPVVQDGITALAIVGAMTILGLQSSAKLAGAAYFAWRLFQRQQSQQAPVLVPPTNP